MYRIIHFQLEFLFEISIPEDSLWKILKKVAIPVGFLKFSIFTLYSIDWNFIWIAILPEKNVCVWGGGKEVDVMRVCVMYVNLIIPSKKSEIYLELLHKSTAQI